MGIEVFLLVFTVMRGQEKLRKFFLRSWKSQSTLCSFEKISFVCKTIWQIKIIQKKLFKLNLTSMMLVFSKEGNNFLKGISLLLFLNQGFSLIF